MTEGRHNRHNHKKDNILFERVRLRGRNRLWFEFLANVQLNKKVIAELCLGSIYIYVLKNNNGVRYAHYAYTLLFVFV